MVASRTKYFRSVRRVELRIAEVHVTLKITERK